MNTEQNPVDIVTYGAHIPVSVQAVLDPLSEWWTRITTEVNAMLAEQIRLDAIGPVHGPPIPDDIRNHRRHLIRIANIQRNLAYGHPTGPYRRSQP